MLLGTDIEDPLTRRVYVGEGDPVMPRLRAYTEGEEMTSIPQDTLEDEWPWPPELDALRAAPEHHTLLFENETVRVLDTCILPGERTNVHCHRWPAFLYVLSWSDFTRYDKEGNVILDSKQLGPGPGPSTALWSGPLPPHSLHNTGDAPLRVISVEIKRPL